MERLAICSKRFYRKDVIDAYNQIRDDEKKELIEKCFLMLGNVLMDVNLIHIGCECRRCFDPDTGMYNITYIMDTLAHEEIHGNVFRDYACNLLAYLRDACDEYNVIQPPADYEGFLDAALQEHWRHDINKMPMIHISKTFIPMLNGILHSICDVDLKSYYYELFLQNYDFMECKKASAVEQGSGIELVADILFDNFVLETKMMNKITMDSNGN